MAGRRSYTTNEIQTMKRMRKEGQSLKEIAEYMGRSYMAIRAKFRGLSAECDLWREIGVERKISNLKYMTTKRVQEAMERQYADHAVTKVHVPEYLWEERDRRANEPASDITASLMGDPKPSRGALGRSCNT